MLDPEELVWTDDQGQQQQIILKDVLMGVDFKFKATQRLVESEQRIGKFLRFMQILQQIAMTNPEFGQLMIQSVDMKFMVQEIARSLDIADLDKLFPNVNIPQQLIETQGQLQQSEMMNQMMSQGIEQAMQEFQAEGNQSAISTVSDIMAQGQEAMAEMGASNGAENMDQGQ